MNRPIYQVLRQSLDRDDIPKNTVIAIIRGDSLSIYVLHCYESARHGYGTCTCTSHESYGLYAHLTLEGVRFD